MKQNNSVDDSIRNNTLSKYKILIWVLIIILSLLGVLSIILGYNTNALYYVGLVIWIPGLFFLFKLHNKKNALRYLLQIRDRWGKADKRDRDFLRIRRVFDYTTDSGEINESTMDDQTWNDLNMDAVYSKIDRVLSNPGESVLYSILRNPLLSENNLLERNRIIMLFQTDQSLREKIQLPLIHLGREKFNELISLLWKDLPPKNPLEPLFSVMALIALFSLGIPFILNSVEFILLPIFIFCINLLIHFMIRKTYFYHIPSITNLSALIKCGKKISVINRQEIHDYISEINQYLFAARKISKKTQFLVSKIGVSSDLIDVLYDYLKIFFLLEVRSFYTVVDEISKNIKELRNFYLLVGKLDCLQSIASYKEELPNYCIPKFTKDELHLEIKDAIHPLLQEPVSNSIRIDGKNIIVTGSNMAGKSTFLRTLGVNVILAQTICVCLASEYKCSLFKIISSISKVDSLLEGKSFYYAECERLLNIINRAQDEMPLLCLIDEVLSGTNSFERMKASIAILKYICKKNLVSVIATHDIEVARKLNGTYENYHFSDKVDQNGLTFDYVLKKGVVKTKNAIKLLDYLGYPSEIVDNAMRDKPE